MILSPQLFWKQPVFMVEQSGERLGSGDAATGDRIGLRLDRIERKRPWYDPKRHSVNVRRIGTRGETGIYSSQKKFITGDEA